MKSNATRVTTPDGHVFREIFNPDKDEGFKQALHMYSQSFFEPTEPSKEGVHKLSNAGFYRIMVMEDENGLVLACVFIVEIHQYKSYHMDYLCVRPGQRGGGLGGKFFTQLTRHLRAEQKYFFITFESEPKLVPWYLRMSCIQLGVISDQVTYENGENFFWWLMVAPLGTIVDNHDSDSDTDSDTTTADSSSTTSTPVDSIDKKKKYTIINDGGVSYNFDFNLIDEIAQYLLSFMSNAKK